VADHSNEMSGPVYPLAALEIWPSLGSARDVEVGENDEDRVNQLSAKAREGSLSEAETQELDSYLHIGSLLAVMQSKARRLLKNAAVSN